MSAVHIIESYLNSNMCEFLAAPWQTTLSHKQFYSNESQVPRTTCGRCCWKYPNNLVMLPTWKRWQIDPGRAEPVRTKCYAGKWFSSALFTRMFCITTACNASTPSRLHTSCNEIWTYRRTGQSFSAASLRADMLWRISWLLMDAKGSTLYRNTDGNVFNNWS